MTTPIVLFDPGYPFAPGFHWPKPLRALRLPKVVSPAGMGREPARQESGQPQVAPEPAGEKRPRLRLAHPHWLETEGEFGGFATACVDAEAPPTAATRIVFRAWAVCGEGRRRDLPAREGHVPEGGGRVAVRFFLEPPAAVGDPAASCRYYFDAKHSLSERVASGALPAGPGREEPGESALFFCPAREEYLVLPTPEDAERLLAEARLIKGLRDAAMRAWDDPDPGSRQASLGNLEPEAQALFGGKPGGDPGRALEELLLVAANPRVGAIPSWIHVRAHARGEGAIPVSGYWRRADDRMIRKRLDALLTPQGGKSLSPLLKTSLRANLLGPGPYKTGQAWGWRKSGKEHGGADGGQEGSGAGPAGAAKAPPMFDFSPEAALGRYFAGWDGEDASFDTGKKRLRLGGAGSASLSLFEGRVSVSLDLPDPEGVNLLAWLGPVKYREAFIRDPRRELRMRLRLEGSLAAFAGLSVHGTLSVAGDFGKKPEAEAGFGLAGFAGGQAKLACQGSLQWSPTKKAADFQVLAALKYGLGASAGLGAEGGFKIEYAHGVFRLRFSGAVCLGLGLKADSGFEIGARAAVAMLGHLLGCVDFHFLGEISSEAFAAYRDLAFGFFALGEEWERAAEAGLAWAGHALGGWTERMGARVGGIRAAEAAIVSRIGDRSRLRQSPPEALGRMLAILTRSREAADSRGVRYILGSTLPSGGMPAGAEPNHKLKWTLRCLSPIAIPAAEGPHREAAKSEALRDGVRILREFGAGEEGHGGSDGRGDGSFADWLRGFLAENGIPGGWEA